MISWLLWVLGTLRSMARSRISLAAENAILRHQLAVLQRGRPRPLLRPADRVLWIWLCRHWKRWRQALVLIQPTAVLRWHREGYRRYWRRRSGRHSGRPRIPRSHISLIHRISSDHPEWGEDRIALELKAKLIALELKAKLGVENAPSRLLIPAPSALATPSQVPRVDELFEVFLDRASVGLRDGGRFLDRDSTVLAHNAHEFF